CHPQKWVQGDNEVAGRWNDYFGLTQHSGERLSALLAFIELLLPFSKRSYLAACRREPGSPPAKPW
ncbi:MAG: hypothetical protein WAO15_11040, partial [Mycobacterium sp.]